MLAPQIGPLRRKQVQFSPQRLSNSVRETIGREDDLMGDSQGRLKREIIVVIRNKGSKARNLNSGRLLNRSYSVNVTNGFEEGIDFVIADFEMLGI